jgi:hypothetical protein
MIESKVVKEWQAQAEAGTLLKVLSAKFGPVPDEVTAAIRGRP